MYKRHTITGVILIIILVVTIPTKSHSFGLADIVNGIVNGSEPDIGKAVLERMQRELCYKLFREALKEADIKGADYFADALRYWIEYKDGGRATAAFLRGLEESDVEGARDIIELLYSAALIGRISSSKVSRDIQSFIDYMTPRLRSYRGVEDIEKEEAGPGFSSPQKTWETFITGLKEGDWRSVAKALTGFIPKSIDLNLFKDINVVKSFRQVVEREKSLFAKAKFTVEKTEKIREDMIAFEIHAVSGKEEDKFWTVFEKKKGAWALVGVIEDIEILKYSAQ